MSKKPSRKALAKEEKILPQLQQAFQLLNEGFFNQAEAVLIPALDAHPKSATALQLLGVVKHRQNNVHDAISCFQKSLSINPPQAQTWFQLGVLYELSGKNEDALKSYFKSLQYDKTHLQSLNNLASLLKAKGRVSEALRYLQTATTCHPKEPIPWASLGDLQTEAGMLKQAVTSYQRALELAPDMHRARSNLLCCYNYDLIASPEAVAKAHSDYDRALSDALKAVVPSPAAMHGDRDKIRVGYVSADFCRHSVSFFFEPLLKHHNSGSFETYCYYNGRKADEVTDRLQRSASHWRNIPELDSQQACETIRNDQIDILVDLTGHTANDRLDIFALRPANIQISWLGYPNTTGLKAMDYRMVDAITDPVGVSDHLCSEELIRIDGGFLCYQGDTDFVPDYQLPAHRNGFITFGSFNNFTKISGSAISAWSKILGSVDNSILLLKSRQLADDGLKKSLLKQFSENGIDKSRLKLIASTDSFASHMKLYNEIDIALDTFPYNGTTTTCEALWMSVPVLTFSGSTHAGRVSASILSQLGLQVLVSEDCESYIDNAVRLANDTESLEALRQDIRPRMENSSLTDGAFFADKLENIYRSLMKGNRTI